MTKVESKSTAVNRRSVKNLLIDPVAQIKTGLWIFLYGFFLTTILYGILILVFSSMMMNLINLIPASPEIDAFFTRAKMMMWMTYGLVSLTSLLGSILLGIRITHRYLGPMQSAQRFIRSLIDETATQSLVLREGDEFALAQDLNELGQKLNPNLRKL